MLSTRIMVITMAMVAVGSNAYAQVDYGRAEQFLSQRINKLILRVSTEPHWLPDGRFWYRTWTARGWQFVLVDVNRRSRTALFDTGRIATALSSAAGKDAVDQTALEFADFKLNEADLHVEFREGNQRFRCDLRHQRCATISSPDPQRPVSHLSPNGRWEAYVDNYNLFVRSIGGGNAIQLTTDGEELHGYGLAPMTPAEMKHGGRLSSYAEPVLAWSPDSMKIAVLRWDYRDVKLMPLYSSTTERPTYYLYPYGLPGDAAVQKFDVHVVDVQTAENVHIDAPSNPPGLDTDWLMKNGVTGNRVWRGVKWSGDSKHLYLPHVARGNKQVSLLLADATTGETRTLISESGPTPVDLKMRANTEPAWRFSSEQDLLWFSWRDGWGHIYRYSADGVLRNQVTKGSWSFTTIEHVDHRAKVVYFTARGREPGRTLYHSYAYRVDLDGTNLTLLTSEDADHSVSFSPDGRYFVDRYSRDDLAPITVLRSTKNGRVLLELERADISRLLALGWKAPELFETVSADGISPIYGRMYRPSHFDPDKRYPIIDNIYPVPYGPVSSWGFSVGGFLDDQMEKQALAELGFVVVAIVGRGTPYRSKAFLDAYTGKMGWNMLPDHITAIRELAKKHRWIDIDRVGIYGMSGGGFAAAAGILRYPEFFKVAVSINGNHDNRSYGYVWGEKFQGLLTRDPNTNTDNYADQANYTLASQLKGKLLLMAGDMDDNVHPANTLRLVHALIGADKKFDFMLFPDRGHGLVEPYARRMTWDYFVEHLMGAVPPN